MKEKEQEQEKKLRQMFRKTDETLKEIQLIGDMRREEIQSAQDDITQKILAHNQSLQENEIYRSAYRTELLQELAEAASTGDFDEMNRIKKLLSQTQQGRQNQ